VRRTLVSLLLILPLAACGAGSSETRTATSPPEPEPTATAESAAEPRALTPEETARRARWATARVVRRTSARPWPGGREVARIGRRTDLGSHRFLSVVGRRDGWLRVIVPELPNHRTAWIREAATQPVGTDISVHIDVSDRRLVVRERGRAIHRMPVGVGGADNPTPTGRFAVTDKLKMGGPGTTYGCCAIALSGHQTQIPPGWPGGDRLAVHGTLFPETIGHAASLGCMRARERDLRRLMRTLELGAPVWIRA
jgi:lipoprotein-anchoring transpeptidase ErfK/SrfK